MKIGYVTMQFPAPSETFAASDVRALSAGGERVTVFALRAPHEHHQTLLEERGLTDVDVRPLTRARARRGIILLVTRPRWTLTSAAWALRWTWRRPRHLLATFALLPGALVAFDDLIRERFDVVHLFWGHYPAIVAHLAEQFFATAVRSTFLGAYDLLAAYGGSAPVARRAHVVWTHVAANVAAISRWGVAADRIQVAYRGVDVPRLAQIREEARGEREPHRIVSVGRLVALKRMPAVITAFAEVQRRRPEATLWIVGDGPDRQALEALAARSGVGGAITFTGHLPHVDVLKLVARSGAFVLLSTTERLPNAAKEAMALGCACVVTETPGIGELIEHERTGYVVENVRPSTVATHLLRALDGGTDVEEMLQAAQRRVAEAFDVTKTMALYQRTWASLVRATEEPDGAPSINPRAPRP